jgi:hypothetical protein
MSFTSSDTKVTNNWQKASVWQRCDEPSNVHPVWWKRHQILQYFVNTCTYCIYTYSNDAPLLSILDWSVACKYLAHQPHIKCNVAGYIDIAINRLNESLQYTYWAPKVSFSIKRKVSVYSNLQLIPSEDAACHNNHKWWWCVSVAYLYRN